MKRIVCLTLTLLLLFALAGCSSAHPAMEGQWEMFTVQDTEKEGTFAAGGTGSGAYAPTLLTATAKDGRLELRDATNQVFYQATYEQKAVEEKFRLYAVTFADGKKGTATLSRTDYRNGSKRATFILTVDHYAITFYPQKTA